jgi:hypothetical protein
LVVFTNFPHTYGEFGGPEPMRQAYFWLPTAFRPSRLPNQVETAIANAVAQYDNIPTELPGQLVGI